MTASTFLLVDEDHPGERYIGAGFGIAITTLVLPILLGRSSMEQLRDEHLAALRSGVRPIEAMARTEARWREWAEDERRGSRFRGWSLIVCGGLLSGVSVWRMAESRPSDGYPPVFVFSAFAGVLILGEGAWMLVTPGPMQRGSRDWSVGRGASASRSSFGAPTLALSGQGASLVWTGSF